MREASQLALTVLIAQPTRTAQPSSLSRRNYSRANLRTVGDVVDAVMTESGLFAVRNLGRKSISEIKTTLLVKAYDELNDRERFVFWCNFAAKNPKPRFEIVGGGEDD